MKSIHGCIFFAIALFFIANSEAASSSDRCCIGDYELGAEFLWWKPCIQDLDICGTYEETLSEAIIDVDFDYKGICPKWEPGLRVWFRYPELIGWCNLGFKASYTYMHVNDRKKHENGEVIGFLIHPGFIGPERTNMVCEGSYESFCHELDALFYFDGCCGVCQSIEPYFGLAALFLEQELKVDHSFDQGELAGTADVKWKSNAWGLGLRMGMAYHYYYSRCLSYYAFGQGTILAASQSGKQSQEYRGTESIDLSLDDTNCWSCVPGFHLGLGAVYDFCVCDFDLALQIGYEFKKWFGIRKHRRFYGDNTQSEIAFSNDPERSFGFHGLNVGLSWCF
jgi:hypothetical protein